MRTLIVGCGYLGLRVGRLLARRGETVFGTVRSAERAARLPACGIEPVIADVLVPESLEALPDVDRTLYCVGFDRSAGVPMRKVYVDGLRYVLERTTSAAGPFLYVSSTGVYGHSDGEWVTESSPAEPTHESGRVCLEAEELALRLGAKSGRPTLIVRLSGLYGPGRLPRRANLLRGEPIVGDPTKFLNMVYIDDAALAAVAALDRGQPAQIYLVSDDRPVPRGEFYERLAELAGAPAPRFEAPIAGSPEAKREESNKRVSNRRMRTELGVVLDYPDITAGLPRAFLDETAGPVP